MLEGADLHRSRKADALDPDGGVGNSRSKSVGRNSALVADLEYPGPNVNRDEFALLFGPKLRGDNSLVKFRAAPRGFFLIVTR